MAGRLGILGLLFCLASAGAERINHEGRILGPQLPVTTPILFNTPEADAVVSSLQIFPVTSAWNEDISLRPLLANSDQMISQIISDLDPARRTLRVFFEMNYVLAPDNQPLVPIDFIYYEDQSDPSPYPIPTNLPIETWPRETGSLTLNQWQLDVNDEGGDRHSIIVQPGTGFLWETWLTKLRSDGFWEAANGARFNLTNNTQRPLGWTSGDAAGLPMFPALIRYDECERGMVEHALRIVVKQSRKQYIYPATHHASDTPATAANVPAMGQRVRLKESFVIPDGWTRHEKAVLKGLKKYGAMVADNGNFFSVSATPDHRWPANAFSHLNSISITNFEVIQTTGPSEGPRSPGAPVADAGPDFSAQTGAAVQLQGNVMYSGAAPAIQWKLYSGPGTATFSDSAQTNATVSFSVPGEYLLMLSASDGVHAVAYDAVQATVFDASELRAFIALSGTNAILSWTGPGSSFVLERTLVLPTAQWTPVLTTAVTSATLPLTNQSFFTRIRRAIN